MRLTLREARARWPQWEAFQERCRSEDRLAIIDKSGSPVLANFLIDVHRPKLPPPTEVVAHALELECGHEEFWLVKQADAAKSPPERMRCPTFWNCHLNEHRAAVRYLSPSEPEPEFVGMGFRWHVGLDCGHDKQVLRREPEGPAAGEQTRCLTCQPDAIRFDARITAIGARLPEHMVQHWGVELDCGHPGTDRCIPVEHAHDPAAYRAAHPRPNGLRCITADCDQRAVLGVRRLGVIGKVNPPKRPPSPPMDPVTAAASDIRRRLTKTERQELIRHLQDEQ